MHLGFRFYLHTFSVAQWSATQSSGTALGRGQNSDPFLGSREKDRESRNDHRAQSTERLFLKSFQTKDGAPHNLTIDQDVHSIGADSKCGCAQVIDVLTVANPEV